MKPHVGTGELYQPIQGLPRGIQGFQYLDKTAFALAGLMLSCLGTAT